MALGAEELWCKLLARPFLFDDFTAGCSHLTYNSIYAIRHQHLLESLAAPVAAAAVTRAGHSRGTGRWHCPAQPRALQDSPRTLGILSLTWHRLSKILLLLSPFSPTEL